MPAGVQCLSARKVYEATEQADTVTADTVMAAPEAAQPPPAAAAPEAWQGRNGNGSPTGQPSLSPVIAPAVRVSQPVATPRLDGPVPIRTPAQVMRIWFGPWEDPAGNLHLTGYVYTEIEPRRWAVGTPAPTAAPTLQPMQLAQRETRRAPSEPPAGTPPAAGGAPLPLFKSKP